MVAFTSPRQHETKHFGGRSTSASKAVAETSGEVEFLCECSRLECTETITLSMAEYERIRSSPVRFP
jgi:hypothetical protein